MRGQTKKLKPIDNPDSPQFVPISRRLPLYRINLAILAGLDERVADEANAQMVFDFLIEVRKP